VDFQKNFEKKLKNNKVDFQKNFEKIKKPKNGLCQERAQSHGHDRNGPGNAATNSRLE